MGIGNDDGVPEWAKITSDLVDNDGFGDEEEHAPSQPPTHAPSQPPTSVSPTPPAPQPTPPTPSPSTASAPPAHQAPAVPTPPPARPAQPRRPGPVAAPQPPTPQPPTPAPPAHQAPTAPAPAPAPVISTAPAAPIPPPEPREEPQPAPPAPSRLPAPESALPTPTRADEPSRQVEDLVARSDEYAQRFEDFEPTPGNEPGPHPGNAAQPETDETDKRKKKRSWRGGGSSKQKTSTDAKAANPGRTRTRLAGGRGVVLALRGLVWVLLVLLIALGVRQMFFPAQTNTQAVTNDVASALGVTGFPVEAGQALAEQFTITYLTQTVGQEQQRKEALLALLPDEQVVGSLGIRGVEQQRIVAGPFLSRPVQSTPTRTTYTFAAQIAATPLEGTEQEPQWVYLAVPVIANDTGIAIAGAPAFVPAVEIATQGEPLPLVNDAQAAKSLTPDLEGFFEAWGASNESELKRYLTSNASLAAEEGLAGEFVFEGLSDVRVASIDPENPQPERDALARVLWRYGPSTVQQEYRLSVGQGADQRWYVVDIKGAAYTVQ